MSINYNTARFLIHAVRLGAGFDRTLTLGRQNLTVTARDLADLLRRDGRAAGLDDALRMKAASEGYCESFLQYLGASSVDSADTSDYEGATVLHDLNAPLPEDLTGRYDAVIDGGTLEHVFDFPRAIRSCMEALRVGGHFLAVTPANNQMGHGFYQFSPELLYRVFAPANGFRVVCLYICENKAPFTWYSVPDPAEVRGRVLLTNFRETHILVAARKEAEVPIFATPPQQSDYVDDWTHGTKFQPAAPDTGRQPSLLRRLAPRGLEVVVRPFVRLIQEAPMLIPSRRMPPSHFRRVEELSHRTHQQSHPEPRPSDEPAAD